MGPVWNSAKIIIFVHEFFQFSNLSKWGEYRTPKISKPKQPDQPDSTTQISILIIFPPSQQQTSN